MVRLHGSAEYEVAESNTGDYIGDVFFICSSLFTGRNVTDGMSLVSLFQVEIYNNYGRYSFCNFYQCQGGSTTLVGRETTSSLGGTDSIMYRST